MANRKEETNKKYVLISALPDNVFLDITVCGFIYLKSYTNILYFEHGPLIFVMNGYPWYGYIAKCKKHISLQRCSSALHNYSQMRNIP